MDWDKVFWILNIVSNFLLIFIILVNAVSFCYFYCGV